MIVSKADPIYRPVTVVLETQDELDKVMSIIDAVATNRIHHTPQLILAAKHMYHAFHCATDDGEGS